MTKITFLGTAGGRLATIMQTRCTGGFIIENGFQMHVDPGPGALINAWSNGIDPRRTDSIFISHCHTEHYGDAEIIIEAMTKGGWEPRGRLITARSVIDGVEGVGPAVSEYHWKQVPEVHQMSPGEAIELDGHRLTATPTHHTDPSGIGFRLDTEHGCISYTGDSMEGAELFKSHEGARLLILNLTILETIKGIRHMTPEKARDLIDHVEPEAVILTHFGKRILRSGPEEIASAMEDNTGIRIVPAIDGMTIEMNENISIE